MNGRYVVAGILLVGLLAGGVVWMRYSKYKAPLPPAAQAHETKVKGPAQAKIQIVEYSDFQCPACQRAQQALNQLLQSYPDQIQLSFYHFPLPNHAWSGVAHQAAECAHQMGQFWPYHDRLYGEQAKWSGPSDPTETFLRYAQDLGLPLDPFASCLADPKIKRKILAEKARGESLEVKSTPTFLINGERVVGPIDLEVKGDALIRKLLGLPQASPPAPSALAPQNVPAAVPISASSVEQKAP